ncbi:MAG: acyltransferase [Frankia sp.]|nr:acyltransferase [Frankia sp.]
MPVTHRRPAAGAPTIEREETRLTGNEHDTARITAPARLRQQAPRRPERWAGGSGGRGATLRDGAPGRREGGRTVGGLTRPGAFSDGDTTTELVILVDDDSRLLPPPQRSGGGRRDTSPGPVETGPDTTGPFLAPLGHNPALDGLRAFAVLAVIGYHAGLSWVPGGLLGVDLFFVLSGFLITGLLIAEYRATRRIDLRDFWIRRVRRLLPALLLLLVAVAAYAKFIAAPADVAKIRMDALASLFYVANWRFALSDQSYFDHFSAPSPLLHTWSLAVEEQFYVLWPLIVFLLMRHSARTVDRWKGQRQKAQSAALTVAVLGAEASALIGLVLLVLGTDPSRIYYGTETRVQALLTGAALAVWRAQRKQLPSERGKKMLSWAGVAAAGALLVIWATVDGESRGLYAGGFLGVAVIVAVLVAAVVEVPNSPIARVLSFGPLTYIGKISYGLYLWHWPVFLAMSASRTGLTGVPLLLARLAVTLAFTLLSYYLVENPIRRQRVRVPMPLVTTPAAIAAVVVLALVATNTSGSSARTPADLERLAREVQEAGRTLPPGSPDAAGNAPLRMLVAGDSLATTLLASEFADVAARMNVQVADATMLGCGVARLPIRRIEGQAGPLTTGCENWPARFTQRVREVDPDIAVLLVGRWEVVDQQFEGRWTRVGDPEYDAYLGRELDLAISTLSARGARVVLFTTPAFAAREAADGSQFPETRIERVVRFNQLLRAAAERHPGVASVADLAGVLTPGDRYTDRIDGILTRDDGVHITAEGGRLAGEALLPEIVQQARPTSTERTPVVTTTAPG